VLPQTFPTFPTLTTQRITTQRLSDSAYIRTTDVNMSQPPDNSGKSKHHSLIPSFLRLKHHLRKNKSAQGKGKGRAEEQPASEPEQGDVSLMGYISAAANQQEPQPEHNCQCNVCTAATSDAQTSGSKTDLSLMGYIQGAASGEAKPEVDCECAICTANNQDNRLSIEQAYFSVPRNPEAIEEAYFSVSRNAEALNVAPHPPVMRARAYHTTYFSGRAMPGTLVGNLDTGNPHSPTEHEEAHQHPQITIPSLHDPLSIYIPSVAATNTNCPRVPVVASPSNMDPQSMNAPPIPPQLLRSLAARERSNEDIGGGHMH